MNSILSLFTQKAHAYDFSFFGTNNGEGDIRTTDSVKFTTVLNNIIGIITIVAAGLAVIYLIYSGIIYITAAGNPDNAKKGQQGVINAIIGIVIIVAAYFIIQIGLGLAGKLTTPGVVGFVSY